MQLKHQSFVYTQLNDQIVLFQTIQFSRSFVCTQFKYQTVLFGVLHIPQSSSITGTPPSNCLVLYPGQSYPSAEVQLVYSAAPANWATIVKIKKIIFAYVSSRYHMVIS